MTSTFSLLKRFEKEISVFSSSEESVQNVDFIWSNLQRFIRISPFTKNFIPDYHSVIPTEFWFLHKFWRGGIEVTLFSKAYNQITDRVVDQITDNQKKILFILSSNPKASAVILSETIGISKRKIEENIKTLKEKSLLRRVGSAKSGYWEVIVEDKSKH
jgi:hypothetical protein